MENQNANPDPKEIESEDAETQSDESQIVSDQDLTNEHDITALDENMGAISQSLDSLEDEPADFMRGEVDVVTQMERTTRAMDEVIEESSGSKAHPTRDHYHP